MMRSAEDSLGNKRMGEAALLKGAKNNTWQDHGDRLLAAFAKRVS